MATHGIPKDFYEKLDNPTSDLRLLRIDAVKDDEPIKCTLTNYKRTNIPVYCALSYTWGSSSTRRRSITINHKDVTPTSSCEPALRHIFGSMDTIPIWVDAICINQSDVDEINAQVGQMRDIYSTASHVFIWLGDEDSYTTLAFELLAQISKLGVYDAASNSSRNFGSSSAWKAVEALFMRAYFERIWIIQEVSLAKSISVHCGTKAMSWKTFNQALQWYLADIAHVKKSITHVDSLIMNAAQVRNEWADHFYGIGDGPDLEFLLSAFSHWKASKLLDKVNGLLGLSKEHAVPELKPDYSKSIREVYTNVVKYFITHDRRLSILGQCQNPPIFRGLPTWVPDWTPDRPYRHQLSEIYRPKGDGQVLLGTDGTIMIPGGRRMSESGYGAWKEEAMIREEMNFSASLDTLAESYFPSANDPNIPRFNCERGPQAKPEDVLMLKGIKVDTIYSITRPLFRVKEDVDDPNFFLEWEKFAIFQTAPDVDAGSFENRIEAFWRTISTDRIFQVRSNLRARSSCRHLFEQWRAMLIKNANPVDAYVRPTLETTNHNDPGARARLMYDAFASTNLSNFATGGLFNMDLRNPATLPQGTPQAIDAGILQEYEDWKRHISQIELPKDPSPPSPSPSGPSEEFTVGNFERNLRHWCNTRKLARTVSGRLALVPEHTRPGDRVYILHGGSVPYITRPLLGRTVTGDTFTDEHGELGPKGAQYEKRMPLQQFVGEAYVHGIMDGEAMEYPAIQRTSRLRPVELNVSHAKGTPELEAKKKITVWKDVPDPLTEEQEALVAAWRDRLLDRQSEVWLDTATSKDL